MQCKPFPVAALIAAWLVPAVAPAADRSADVVIYGGTSAGVAAAVQTVRMGKSVILIEPKQHVGGLTVSGLGMTDTGNKAVIGGVSREFYQRVKQKYDELARWPFEDRANYDRYRAEEDAQWTFEPHVASEVFAELLAESKVRPLLGASLTDLTVSGTPPRINSLALSNGDRVAGKRFIDATYEGDLLAQAGVSHTVGREANALYGETLNGIQVAQSLKHQFIKDVDPFRVKGDRSSGLLPGIGDGPGTDGEADERVQAYNYRLCLTDVKANQIPFAKPAGYAEVEFELLLRNFEAGDMRVPLSIAMMPNRKTDVNNNFAVSTDYIAMNYAYPTASLVERAKIEKAHELYTRGLMWTLANHLRVPESIRRDVGRWGWAKNEWTDNNHWPYWIYVREARRIVSDYVQIEQDCTRERVCDDSVGLGSYNMDSHNVQRYVNKDGFVRNEGDVQVSPGGPYLISYRALVPRQGECANLFVPVCLSSSHIAYGSIRMEPVFMILGQSAATGACLSIDRDCAVQEVPYALLRQKLLADKQVLDIPPGSTRQTGIRPGSLPGIVIDDTQAIKTGEWETSSSTPGYVGAGYMHDNNTHGGLSIRYPVKVPAAGRYTVRASFGPHGNRATNAKYTITHAGGETAVTVNQRTPIGLTDAFVKLGSFEFAGGEHEAITLTNAGADGYVIADAVWLIAQGE